MGFDGRFRVGEEHYEVPRPLVWMLMNHSSREYELGQLGALTGINLSPLLQIVPSSPGAGRPALVEEVSASIERFVSLLSEEVIRQVDLKVVEAQFIEQEFAEYLSSLVVWLADKEGSVTLSIY